MRLPTRQTAVAAIVIALAFSSAGVTRAQADEVEPDRTRMITGTVSSTDGKPVPDVQVGAYSHHTGRWWTEEAIADVNADGKYTLMVAPGVYRVAFWSHEPGLYSKIWENGTDLNDGQDVYVYAPSVGAIDAVLERQPVVDTPPEVEPHGYWPSPVQPIAPVKHRASIGFATSANGMATITVKAGGVMPTGKVSIRLRGRTAKKVTLRSGRASFRLGSGNLRKRTYTLVYPGDSRVAGPTVKKAFRLR